MIADAESLPHGTTSPSSITDPMSHEPTSRVNGPTSRESPAVPFSMRQAERSRDLVELVAGRWTLAVLSELGKGGRRYQDLHDALGGISYKVLTDTVRRAERDGLVARHLDSSRVEGATLYELTELGRSLDAPLGGFAQWVDANWPAVEGARRRWN